MAGVDAITPRWRQRHRILAKVEAVLLAIYGVRLNLFLPNQQRTILQRSRTADRRKATFARKTLAFHPRVRLPVPRAAPSCSSAVRRRPRAAFPWQSLVYGVESAAWP